MVLHQMHSLVEEEELVSHLALEEKVVQLVVMVLQEKVEQVQQEVLDKLLELVEDLQQLVQQVKVMAD
jgi:hypothetical protein